MSKRALRAKSLAGSAQRADLRGACLMVDGAILGDTLMLKDVERSALLQSLDLMTAHYEVNTGLPPRAFYFCYELGQLMVLCFRQNLLILLIEPHAELADLEIAGRKLVSTAHLDAGLNKDNPIMLAMRPVEERSTLASSSEQVKVSSLPSTEAAEPAMQGAIASGRRHSWLTPFTLGTLVGCVAWAGFSPAPVPVEVRVPVPTLPAAALAYMEAFSTGDSSSAQRHLLALRADLPAEKRPLLDSLGEVMRERESASQLQKEVSSELVDQRKKLLSEISTQRQAHADAARAWQTEREQLMLANTTQQLQLSQQALAMSLRETAAQQKLIKEEAAAAELALGSKPPPPKVSPAASKPRPVAKVRTVAASDAQPKVTTAPTVKPVEPPARKAAPRIFRPPF